MHEDIHTETPQQYQARVNSYVADNDPIAMLRAAPSVLAKLIERAPDALLNWKPASAKWSVRAILAHLSEDELASSWRYRQMIGHNSSTLPGFNQTNGRDSETTNPGPPPKLSQCFVYCARPTSACSQRSPQKSGSGTASTPSAAGLQSRSCPPHGRTRREPHHASETQPGTGAQLICPATCEDPSRNVVRP